MLEAATLGTIGTFAGGATSASISTGATKVASTVSTLATLAKGAAAAATATGPTAPPDSVPWGFTAAGGQIMGLFMDGGPFMWPILLASLVTIVYLIDRLVSLSSELRATRKIIRSFESIVCQESLAPEELEKGCMESLKSPVATMAIAGLEKYRAGDYENVERAVDRVGMSELGRLEKGLPALASVSNIAPLIGFLGTVWGIVLAFHVIGMKKVVNPQDISDGISQALIMSAAGLAVAIPASGSYNFFATRISRIAVMMQHGAYLLNLMFINMMGEQVECSIDPASVKGEKS